MNAHIPALLLVASLAAPVYAASPRELVKQKAAALAAQPSNAVLRREILTLAAKVKPPLAVPAAVDEEVGRAEYAMKEAKGPGDYAAAAKAFQKAVDLAPWSADFYFNLGVAHEKAAAATAAIEAFELYLVGAPQAKDARDVRRRIGGLKMQAEKDAGEAQAQAQKQANVELLKRLAESVASELNGIYSGKSFKKLLVCSGNGSGCNKDERAGSNWETYIPNDPQKITFKANASGEVEAYTGFSTPQFLGIPVTASWGDVKWRAQSDSKPVYLKFYSSGSAYRIYWGAEVPPDNFPDLRFRTNVYE